MAWFARDLQDGADRGIDDAIGPVPAPFIGGFDIPDLSAVGRDFHQTRVSVSVFVVETERDERIAVIESVGVAPDGGKDVGVGAEFPDDFSRHRVGVV